MSAAEIDLPDDWGDRSHEARVEWLLDQFSQGELRELVCGAVGLNRDDTSGPYFNKGQIAAITLALGALR